MAGQSVSLEKGFLEKAATIERFEYSPLGSELKKQNDLAKDQYKASKDQKNVIDNNSEGGDEKEEDI